MAIKVYFGSPGAGKTTHAASIALKYQKQGVKVFSNFPLSGCYQYDPVEDFGNFLIEDCIVLFDEAGISANNRKFKSLPHSFIEFLKLYRHFHVKDIYVYSQAPDDMDITIRRLSTEFYLLKKSIIRPFSYTRRIARIIGEIDPITHQLTDGYKYIPFSRRYIYRPKYYNMFDSWQQPYLPSKEFNQYPETIKPLLRHRLMERFRILKKEAKPGES